MAPPTTELAFLPLLAGSDPLNPDSPAGKLAQEALTTVSDQPGYQRASYGVQEEDKSMLVLAIDWDSLEAHKQFIASADYGPFLTKLKTILAGAPTLIHIAYEDYDTPPTTHLTKTSAPVTEMVMTYVPADKVMEEYKKTQTENLIKFSKILNDGTPANTTCTSGWMMDEAPVQREGKEPEMMSVGLVGWNSIDDHMAARENQAFKDNVNLIRGGDVPKDIVIRHVKFQQI